MNKSLFRWALFVAVWASAIFLGMAYVHSMGGMLMAGAMAMFWAYIAAREYATH